MIAEDVTRLAAEIRGRIRAECPDIIGLAVVELVATGILADVRAPGTERQDAERLCGAILRRLRRVRAERVARARQH